MKICIVGAGAIGGVLGIRLADAGHDVSLLARGAHLAALRANGAKLIDHRGETLVRVAASDDPADFGPQDYVVITLKTPSLPAVVPKLAPLLGDDTAVVTAMNGIPWWFCQHLDGPLKGRQLQFIDPDGALAAALPPERIIGGVVHAGASASEPGVIRHAAGDLFILGESDGTIMPRTKALGAAITEAGLTGRVTERIHQEIWTKLIGNMGMGPISALTRLTLSGIANDRDARPIAVAMMEEAIAIGGQIGLHMDMSAEARVDLGAELGDFKPSILQDLEKGRPMEIDALIGVVAELGRLVDIPTPTIDIVLALQRAQARCAGLY
ncbi:MAG: 2-dehydropantoate 2-reductase [Alphaproteobacteria bacterium]|nr:2-dehydropantoate 2-reductase [Alphaproteobacteria bacterium]